MKPITPLQAFLEDNLGTYSPVYDRGSDTVMIGLGMSDTGLVYQLIDNGDRVRIPTTLQPASVEEIAYNMLLKAALLGPRRPLDLIQDWFERLDLTPAGLVALRHPTTHEDVLIVVPDSEFLGRHCINSNGGHGLGIFAMQAVCRLGPPIKTRYQRLREA